MFTSRRAASLLAGAAIVTLGLAACAPPGASEDPGTSAAGTGQETTSPADETTSEAGTSEATGEPVDFQVGFIAPLTGAVAIAGQEMQQGWDLYWELNGDTVGNVTVSTIVEDDAGNPDTSLQKATRLVEQEGVDIVVGPLLANTALAVAAYTTEAGVPNLHPVTAADALTQGDVSPLVLRAGSMTSSQMNFPAGDWAAKEGYQTAVTLCPDYAFGWESCAGFARTFTEGGGEITEQLWFPLGTQDFSPYVSQLQAAGADIAFVTTAGGADGPNFFSTFNDFGLSGQQDILTNCCAVDQATIRALGDAMLGVHSASYWAEGRDTPEVNDFVAAYQEAYEGRVPSLNVAGGYTTAQVVAMALEATGGTASPEDFVAAARAVELPDSLFGPLTFDEYNNPVMPVYIREIQAMDDGTIRNVPIETYDEVSQFWTYDVEEYLTTVPYTRDNQGIASNG